MEFMQVVDSRYSVRSFSDKPVEKDLLDEVLKIAMVAPTGKNNQPHRIYVLQGEENLAKIDGLTRCRFGAPCVLAFTYNTEEEWKNPLEEGPHSGVEDASIAATYVMLRATELGLGTIWVNFFPNTKFEEAFGIPANERSVLLMPIGYRADDAEPAPRHFESRPLEEVVKFL